jgi:hypothetical protein
MQTAQRLGKQDRQTQTEQKQKGIFLAQLSAWATPNASQIKALNIETKFQLNEWLVSPLFSLLL